MDCVHLTRHILITLRTSERTLFRLITHPYNPLSMQMFQFVTNMAQAAYCQLYSPYPKQLSTLLFFYMITLLALFLNFYLGKHGSSNKQPQAGPKNGHKKSV